eukprot:7022595-Alexandrium_andersonii.AAC.1
MGTYTAAIAGYKADAKARVEMHYFPITTGRFVHGERSGFWVVASLMFALRYFGGSVRAPIALFK